MDKKKTLILSILGVVVLVIAVVGISYAMYTFTGTGSKENLITTGSVSVDVPSETNTITLDSSYSANDATGTGSNETLEFSVVSNLEGDAPINYEVGFDVVESAVVGGLKAKDVKFNLRKGTDTYLLETTATTGITLASRYASAGTIEDTGGNVVINHYLVDSGTLTGNQTFNYVVKAWISEDYNLPTTGTGSCTGGTVPTTETACDAIYGIWNDTTGTCALADAPACNSAGGTWSDTTGGTHSNSTAASTLTFKIKVVAAG